ncbi:MAG: FAD-dependent oxidoreductase, partial [Elusimicrobiota bacterium]
CTEEALERIGEETAQIAPRVRELPIKGSWAGLRPATRDNLPIIGKAPGWDNLFLAAGHFRKGVLLAPWTGQTLARLIMGRPSDIPIGDFSPSRFVAQIRKL